MFRRAVLVTLVVLGATLTNVLPAAASSDMVYPPGSSPLGMSYKDWAAAYWQWVLGGSADTNPALDPTGNCGRRQPADAWFLAASLAVGVQASCDVPAGMPLLVLPAGYECSRLENSLTSEADLQACARAGADLFDVASIRVEVDGQRISVHGFRTTTRKFIYHAPAHNLFGDPPLLMPMAGTQWMLMLKPLAPGDHTVFLSAEIPGVFAADITHRIHVAG